MTSEAALLRLAEQTAAAVCSVLEAVGAPEAEPSRPVVLERGAESPLEHLPAPGVVSGVAYVDGVTGGNVFGISLEGARALAAAMMGAGPSEDAVGAPLTELELSAVSEAMNQMMAAAAAATGAVLGKEIEIGPPQTRAIEAPGDAAGAFGDPAAHVTVTALTVCGEPCRLVQLVPSAFVVRMTRALDELGADRAGPGPDRGAGDGAGGAGLGPSLLATRARVWAELGRAVLPAGRVVGLAAGSVVELDRAAEDPVDVLVNGLPFATGRLVVGPDGDWAVRIETIVAGTPGAHPEPEKEEPWHACSSSTTPPSCASSSPTP